MTLKVIHGIISYLPKSYTWIYNQLKYFKDIQVLILTFARDPDRKSFPLLHHELFSFPGIEAGSDQSSNSFLRKIVRMFPFDLRLESFVFAWKARKGNYRAIHAHFANIGWKFIPLAKLLKLPLIVSFYGYDYDFLPNTQPKWKRRYQELFKAASLFLTEGEFGRKKLIDKGVLPQKVKVHHLGVDTDSIMFRSRDHHAGDKLRLIQVASFNPKKGQRILIEALDILKRSGILNISLTFVGDGLLKEEIEVMSQSRGLAPDIKFVLHWPYDQLHENLLNYHIFVHPSLTTNEGDCEGGAPVVLLDAQATGMAVISTFHCDIPEVVLHEKTGILVKENSPEELALAIKKFRDNPSLLANYGIMARKHVEENYSAKIQADRLAQIYSTLNENFRNENPI